MVCVGRGWLGWPKVTHDPPFLLLLYYCTTVFFVGWTEQELPPSNTKWPYTLLEIHKIIFWTHASPSCFKRFYRGLLMYVVAVQIHSAHSARPPFKSYAAWRDESSSFFDPSRARGQAREHQFSRSPCTRKLHKMTQRALSPRPLALLATPNSF